jgi:Tol biopolymer transport system component
MPGGELRRLDNRVRVNEERGPIQNINWSADSRLLAFDSGASLIMGDENNAYDAYLYDCGSSVLEAISVSKTSESVCFANGTTQLGSKTSANGRLVPFATLADNLTAKDENRAWDVYVADLAAGTNVLVSVNTNGITGNGSSSVPEISEDGRFITFSSYASDLVDGDTNGRPDVFLRDLVTSRTILVSRGITGFSGGGSSSAPAISRNGKWIVYETTARDLTDGISYGGSGPEIVLYDIEKGTNRIISLRNGLSTTSGKSQSPVISSNGDWIAYQTASTQLAATPPTVTGPLYSVMWDKSSEQGKYTNVGLGKADNAEQRFAGNDGELLINHPSSIPSAAHVYNVTSHTSSLLCQPCSEAALSNDGQWVLFRTIGTITDLLLVSRTTQLTSIVSAAENGGKANGSSFGGRFSPMNDYIVFASRASNLIDRDLNNVSDIFLHDLRTGSTLLASHGWKSRTPANRISGEARFSEDGKSILFLSFASDLVESGDNEHQNIFASVLPPMDSDNDQLSDAWEISRFGDLSKTASTDEDGDRLSNLGEMLAGTDPLNSQSTLSLHISRNGSDLVRIRSLASGRFPFDLEYCTNLTGNVWMPISAAGIDFLDTATNSAARFYRIKVAR